MSGRCIEEDSDVGHFTPDLDQRKILLFIDLRSLKLFQKVRLTVGATCKILGIFPFHLKRLSFYQVVAIVTVQIKRL